MGDSGWARVNVLGLLARLASAKATNRCAALERLLRETQERFEDLLAISSDWIWETDAEHRPAFSGRLAESGVDPDALIGKQRTDIIDPSLAEAERRLHLDDLAVRAVPRLPSTR